MKTDKEKKKERQMSVAANTRRRMKEHRSFESSTLQLPKDVSTYSFKTEDPVRLDILPYKVTQEGNPHADVGTLHWERTYQAHRVGKNNKLMICPNRTAGKPCPICEYQKELRSDPEANKDIIKSLYPRERQLFNVIDLSDPKKIVRVFDISNFLFGAAIDALIDNADEDEKDEIECFADLKGGKTIKATLEKQSFDGSNPFFKVKAMSFKPREDYDEDKLDECHDLDSLLKIPEYDELKKAFEEDEKSGDGGDGNSEDTIEVGSKVSFKEGKLTITGEVTKIKNDMAVVEDDDGEDHKVDLDELALLSEEKKEKADEDEGNDEIKVGDKVKWEDDDGNNIEGEVTKIKGEKVTIEDDDGEDHKADIDEVTLLDADEKEKTDEEDGSSDEIKVGSKVKWGKKTGEVTKIKGDVAVVEDDDGEDHKVDLDDLTIVD